MLLQFPLIFCLCVKREFIQKQSPGGFCNKVFLRKFHKIHRKTPASEWPGACNFIKRETLTQVFSCELCEISKNAFFKNNSGVCFWLLTDFWSIYILISYPLKIPKNQGFSGVFREYRMETLGRYGLKY